MRNGLWTIVVAAAVTPAPTVLGQNPAEAAVERAPEGAVELHQEALARVFRGFDVKVIDAQGVRTVAHTLPSPADGSVLAGRTGSEVTASHRDGDLHYQLPFELATPDAELTSFVTYEAVARVSGGGARYDGLSRNFVARLLVGFTDSSTDGGRTPLPQPFEVRIVPDAGSADPDPLVVEETNRLYDVQLTFASAVESVVVQLVPEFDPVGSEIDVPVLKASLAIGISPRAILGFGLQEATITVHGQGRQEGERVALLLDRGTLDPPEIVFDDAGYGRTKLRSTGIGRDTVTICSDVFVYDPTPVDYVWPWSFLLLAMVGGGLGSGIRWWKLDRPKKHTGVVRAMVHGLAAGVVGAVLLAVGVNWLGGSLEPGTSEGAAFAAGALAPLVGLPILRGRRRLADWMKKRHEQAGSAAT